MAISLELVPNRLEFSRDGSYCSLMGLLLLAPLWNHSWAQTIFILETEMKKPVEMPTKQAQISHISVQENTQLQKLYKKPDGLDIPEGMDVVSCVLTL